jgi:hypothetical protein
VIDALSLTSLTERVALALRSHFEFGSSSGLVAKLPRTRSRYKSVVIQRPPQYGRPCGHIGNLVSATLRAGLLTCSHSQFDLSGKGNAEIAGSGRTDPGKILRAMIGIVSAILSRLLSNDDR